MNKTLWKELWRTIWSTKTRFISLFLLMALGSFALIGLKVTSPDLAKTANHFIDKNKVMDLSLVASYGFSAEDLKDLRSIPDMDYELGRLLDAEIIETQKSIRLFSIPKKISKLSITKGRLPQKESEIAISSWQAKNYRLGQMIEVKTSKKKLIRSKSLKIVGFVNASEIWSKQNLGSSQAGDGNLALYGFLSSSNFEMDNNIARITFKGLKDLDAFSKAYKLKLEEKEKRLERVFADNAEKRLSSLKEESLKKIRSSEEQIAKAQKEIAIKEKSLQSLPQVGQVKAAMNELLVAKAKLEEEGKQIKESQKSIKQLAKPSYTIYNRETIPGGDGYNIYDTSMTSISQVGNIFPVVLYLVAALVTFTTMTRFVDEERTNSGLYLALGYKKNAIFTKFLTYGFLASFLGTSLGVLGGTYFLSSMIAEIVTKPLVIGRVQMDFYWTYTLLAYLLASLSALLPVYIIVRRELFQKPAQLLLPKPPSKGGQIFLERIPLIWQRLSFTYKVTVRNIFRYKLRMSMTIFGVAGSVALLFSGLGIQSSLSKVVDHQFRTLTPYDIMVIGKTSQEGADRDLSQSLLTDKEIKEKERITVFSTNLVIKGQSSKRAVTLIATSDSNLSPLINLRDSKTQKTLSLPKEGVILSKKLASFYGVSPGHNLSLKTETNQTYKVKVVAIADMNVGHYLFMSQAYQKKRFSQAEFRPGYLLSLDKGDAWSVKSYAKKLLNRSTVQAVSQNTLIVETVKSVVSSLREVMTLLVVLSLMLALVILYNLTAINIAERLRELSTVKVLGFYDYEVTLYIYRETAFLSVIGMILGLFAGKYLHQLLMSLMGSSNMSFGHQVDSYVYFIPLIAISLIVMLLGLMVHYQLQKLAMLEALKSVD